MNTHSIFTKIHIYTCTCCCSHLIMSNLHDYMYNENVYVQISNVHVYMYIYMCTIHVQTYVHVLVVYVTGLVL